MENKERDFNFKYGKLLIQKRWDREIPGYPDKKEVLLEKVIRTGVEIKALINGERSWVELQILYKDENDTLQCMILECGKYIVKVLEIGNAQIEM